MDSGELWGPGVGSLQPHLRPPPTSPFIKPTESQTTLAAWVSNGLVECRFAPSYQAGIASDTRKCFFQKYDVGWVRLQYLGSDDGTSKWLVLQ